VLQAPIRQGEAHGIVGSALGPSDAGSPTLLLLLLLLPLPLLLLLLLSPPLLLLLLLSLPLLLAALLEALPAPRCCLTMGSAGDTGCR
jgi:hypothetical protein